MRVDEVLDERVAHLTRRGHSTSEIADLLKIARRTVHRARARTGTSNPGDSKRPSKREISAEMDAFVNRLIEEECPIDEIARTVGMGRHAVTNRWPHARGVAFEDQGMLNRARRDFKKIEEALDGPTKLARLRDMD